MSSLFVTTKEPMSDQLFRSCIDHINNPKSKIVAEDLRTQMETFWLAVNEYFEQKGMYSPKYTAANNLFQKQFQQAYRAEFPEAHIQEVEDNARYAAVNIYGAMLAVVMPD